MKRNSRTTVSTILTLSVSPVLLGSSAAELWQHDRAGWFWFAAGMAAVITAALLRLPKRARVLGRRGGRR
jgi:hypothetical protein